MIDVLDLLLQILRVDIFISFGFYSILYLLMSLFTKSELLKSIDDYSCKIITYSGLLFLLVWMSLVVSTYLQSSAEEQSGMMNRMFGRYWFGYWLQPVLWISLTQFFRFKTVRRSRFLRILFSFIFMVSIEQFVIIVTSLHRDYLPSSWSVYNGLNFPFTTWELILGIATKILFFLTIVAIYYFVDKKLKLRRVK